MVMEIKGVVGNARWGINEDCSTEVRIRVLIYHGKMTPTSLKSARGDSGPTMGGSSRVGAVERGLRQ
jgi:hypothetical protein